MADDLISRQAAIDMVSGLIEEQRFYDIIGKLESLPSAQPECVDCTWKTTYWCDGCKAKESE